MADTGHYNFALTWRVLSLTRSSFADTLCVARRDMAARPTTETSTPYHAPVDRVDQEGTSMFFTSKQKKIHDQITQYRETVLQCMDAFAGILKRHCENSDTAIANSDFNEVHKAESRADDIRREIEVTMYSKALFPESRGDILGLLETMDKVPNQAEECVRMIYEQGISVPEELVPQVARLVEVCVRCVSVMTDAVEQLFSNYRNAAFVIGRIDELETEADHIESSLKRQVFASDIDGMQKILLRDLIKGIAALCDRSETVGDRIRIIVAKRSI